MHDYLKRCAMAAVASAVALTACAPMIWAAESTKLPRHLNIEMKRDDMRAARRQRYVWPGLEQQQIDALTKATRGMSFPEGIVIFCADDSRCGDLALDFDNAFESAKLKSSIDKPFINDTQGLSSSTKELAEVVSKATGLQVTVMPPPYSGPVDCMPGTPMMSLEACGAKPGPKKLAIGKRL